MQRNNNNNDADLLSKAYLLRDLRFPIFQPQLLKVLTTLGVAAAVNGTRMKIKLL